MKPKRYRAPREHRAALVVPPTERLPEVVRENRALLAGCRFRVLDRDYQTLRQAARERFLAIPYRCQYARVPPQERVSPERPIILTGHQPALYHPGVWLKNFLAGHLARAADGVAVNLNVDNDEAHQVTIRAPVASDGSARRVEARYLRDTGGVPYEELSEEHLLEGVADELRALGVAPSLCDAVEAYWARLRSARGRDSLVKTITCARHELERSAGLHNLEALVSDVARQDEFRVFFLDILRDLRRFHEAHNGGLLAFRDAHHEKNPAQPVPDLASSAGRLEMPFWVWRRGGRRQRLWAQVDGREVCLFYDEESEPLVSLETGELTARGQRPLTQLAELESAGVKIRPRALTLTLFARMFLGDLFIHGLGGAIYDQVTDEIIRRFYGVEPPQFVMATGTALLPLACYNVTAADRRAAQRRLRDVRHNPDRLMPDDQRAHPEAVKLIERKWRLIRNQAETRQQRAAAWRQVHDINHRLAGALAREPEATRERLVEIENALACNAVLRDREYPFVLHPRDELFDFYREVSAPLLAAGS